MNEQSQIKETLERSAAACAEILAEHRTNAGDIERTLTDQHAAVAEVLRATGQPPQR